MPPGTQSSPTDVMPPRSVREYRAWCEDRPRTHDLESGLHGLFSGRNNSDSPDTAKPDQNTRTSLISQEPLPPETPLREIDVTDMAALVGSPHGYSRQQSPERITLPSVSRKSRSRSIPLDSGRSYQPLSRLPTSGNSQWMENGSKEYLQIMRNFRRVKLTNDGASNASMLRGRLNPIVHRNITSQETGSGAKGDVQEGEKSGNRKQKKESDNTWSRVVIDTVAERDSDKTSGYSDETFPVCPVTKSYPISILKPPSRELHPNPTSRRKYSVHFADIRQTSSAPPSAGGDCGKGNDLTSSRSDLNADTPSWMLVDHVTNQRRHSLPPLSNPVTSSVSAESSPCDSPQADARPEAHMFSLFAPLPPRVTSGVRCETVHSHTPRPQRHRRGPCLLAPAGNQATVWREWRLTDLL